MKQYTEILQIRVSKDMNNWLSILEQKYKKKKCTFIRDAIIEKFKNDVPILRLQKKSITTDCPF